MSTDDDKQNVTRLLHAAAGGDQAAGDELLPIIYEQLRGLAYAWLRQGAANQTLQPTALVHEAYLRLVGVEDPRWENRGHFFFTASRAMHDILVEQARRKASKKRGGDWNRRGLDHLAVATDAPPEDLIALSEALEQLERDDARSHRLVMLRFFGGLTLAESAEAMGISLATAKRDWVYARTRLHRTLTHSLSQALRVSADG
jgi:RNA polymerase sigma factor (TIGR02999 family)